MFKITSTTLKLPDDDIRIILPNSALAKFQGRSNELIILSVSDNQTTFHLSDLRAEPQQSVVRLFDYWTTSTLVPMFTTLNIQLMLQLALQQNGLCLKLLNDSRSFLTYFYNFIPTLSFGTHNIANWTGLESLNPEMR